MVSTNGQSPKLANLIKLWIERSILAHSTYVLVSFWFIHHVDFFAKALRGNLHEMAFSKR